MRSGTALFLVALALGACSTTAGSGVEGLELRRASLDPALIEILESARERLEAGDLRGASDRYASLAAAHPEDPWLAALHQEARYTALDVDSTELEANLRRSYRKAADDDPTPLRLLLAARAEGDAYAALNLADRALVLDPDFAWGHYARAHTLTQLGRTTEAKEEVERAVILDASLLPAWRLLAWLRSQAGERDAAIATWRAWLGAAAEDPRVSNDARIEAVCDLGVLLVRAKRHEEAVDLLDEASLDTSGRSSSVLAAAAIESGDVEGALAAVRAARERDAEVLLFVVQEALLLEQREPHSSEAHEAWQEVIERTQGTTELSALLQRTRAEAHLQRMEDESDADQVDAEGAD